MSDDPKTPAQEALEVHYSANDVPANAVAGLAKINASRPLARLKGDAQTILDRLSAGETAPAIAKELGIYHSSLYEWLLQHAPTEWQLHSAAKQLVRIEQCEDGFDTPGLDGPTVARITQKAKLAQWQLERTSRKLYGDSKQDGNNGVNIQIVMQTYGPDGQPIVTVQGEQVEPVEPEK